MSRSKEKLLIRDLYAEFLNSPDLDRSDAQDAEAAKAWDCHLFEPCEHCKANKEEEI